LCGNRVGRTDIYTGTTVNTFIRINYVDIPFRNRIHRAFGNAASASYTSVTNYMSHFGLLDKINSLIIGKKILKIYLFPIGFIKKISKNTIENL